VLRGVVGGGFVWSGDLGCYVGGRAKPLETMGGKGFLGMPPAKGVPRRFLEMPKKVGAPNAVQIPAAAPQTPAQVSRGEQSVPGTSAKEGASGDVKTEDVVVV
jgi:vacuolar protein sorting-associated protein 72